MAPLFEVEGEVKMPSPPGTALVIARRLDDADFEITPTTKLNDRRVLHFDVPRVLDAAGEPRRDVVGFIVESNGGEGFSTGEVVELVEA